MGVAGAVGELPQLAEDGNVHLGPEGLFELFHRGYLPVLEQLSEFVGVLLGLLVHVRVTPPWA